MIVTNDVTSEYTRVPTATLNVKRVDRSKIGVEQGKPVYEMSVTQDISTMESHSNLIYTEYGFSFWRFDLKFALQDFEQMINYYINSDDEHSFEFYLPTKSQTMNTMFHSCNGFSLAVDPSEFKGRLWADVLAQHKKDPFHVMLGGGDQIYCDGVKTYTQTVSSWINEKNPIKKHQMEFDESAEREVEQFYLHHYIGWFGSGFWKGTNGSTVRPDLPAAMAQIPMINLWDDHDIIDGFGSYPDHTMKGAVFSGIGNVSFKYYLLFQHCISPEDSSEPDPCYDLGDKVGPFIKQKARSIYARLGNSVAFYGLDCRTERKRDQIVRKSTYQKMFDRISKEVDASNGEIRHLLLMLGVPIAYPRLVWLETLLASRFMAPFKVLAKHGVMSGLVNQFDGRIEILDDLDDHWCAKHHKRERNELVRELQVLAKQKKIRITILSGDVHLSAIGRFYSKASDISPINDHRGMLNIICSAIVNTPPPDSMADFLNKRNKIHHYDHNTSEDMVHIFTRDVDGHHRNNSRLLPRRNWCSIKVQGENATGGSLAAGPLWMNTAEVAHTGETQYPDLPSSLSVVIHSEVNRLSETNDTKPYQVLVPVLE